MAIPEAQLATWMKQGAIATAKTTHESIRHCLEVDGQSRVLGRGFEIFLQGSYKNDTNIFGDSDVDVVVVNTDIFNWDGSGLPLDQRMKLDAWMGGLGGVTYSSSDFKRDVLATLTAYYGAASVNPRPKCITVAADSGRLSADVIVCVNHRFYTRFENGNDARYIEGIAFWTPEGDRITNFPKHHYNNGVVKHAENATNGWYKPTVRMVKNFRKAMVDRRALADGIAPSYFVECLVYNAPNACFGGTCQATMIEILNWANKAPLSAMFCKNGFVPLFGTGRVHWTEQNARTFIHSAINAWNGWN